MVDFQHVDSKTAERLRDLADRARVTLIAAGIPAFDSEDSSPAAVPKLRSIRATTRLVVSIFHGPSLGN
jgi:hypothetical protein